MTNDRRGDLHARVLIRRQAPGNLSLDCNWATKPAQRLVPITRCRSASARRPSAKRAFNKLETTPRHRVHSSADDDLAKHRLRTHEPSAPPLATYFSRRSSRFAESMSLDAAGGRPVYTSRERNRKKRRSLMIQVGTSERNDSSVARSPHHSAERRRLTDGGRGWRPSVQDL